MYFIVDLLFLSSSYNKALESEPDPGNFQVSYVESGQ